MITREAALSLPWVPTAAETALTTPSEFTFGVEIEVFSPYPRDELADLLTKKQSIDARVVWFTHDVTPYWKLLRDGTLVDECPKNHYGIELVSPVLSGEKGIEETKKVIKELKVAPVITDDRTGLHVHVGRPREGWTLPELKKLAKAFILQEETFDGLVSESRRGDTNPQLRSNAALWGDRDLVEIDAATDIHTLINLVNSNGHGDSCRYFKLNFEAVKMYGTVEFRQQTATVDSAATIAWIDAVLHFCRWTLQNDFVDR
ncbi:putative amidoligase [Fimicolochytrium jonesii]|uniref:putative amidoligase n=1 Tax=Fimicolochytrium jonesii TaxID=1396493 RepID=UPI0022FDB2C3|nr:putative amidoligase [Fimicolochytrium jonesii]KAI8821109.1 putative amidoligase [Fimicolochytrium jonesii]